VYEAGVAGRGKCEEGAFAVGDLERFWSGGGGGVVAGAGLGRGTVGGFGAFVAGWGTLRVWIAVLRTLSCSWEGRLLSLLLSLLVLMRVPEVVAYGTLALGFVLVLVFVVVLVVVVTVVVVIR
jgi:hypothetical protein